MPDWTPDQDARLRALHDDSLSFAEIGEQLGTTREAVRSRWKRIRDGVWESKAREENEQPWDPPLGMTKVRCARCSFWFAAARQASGLCPECVAKGRGI